MAIKRQSSLLLVALLLLIAGTLSISYQANTLSYLNQEFSDTETQVSNLINDWEALTLERWMLLHLGTYPRNASSLGSIEGIKAFIFYSNVSLENLTSRFDLLAENLSVTITYLELANQTNLHTLKDICNKTGFPEPPSQSYVIVLNSSRIICLGLKQVDNEVFGKCVEYLSLSSPET